MDELDKIITDNFQGLVVRKDLVKAVKGNAIVPTYVLEYLLGQYCATSDEDSISTGIDTVKEILRKHYVHRSEAGLVRSNIKEKGRYKVIDKISVILNDKQGVYEAQFSNLGVKKVLVDSATIKAHPKLLVSGVWCIADVEYEFSDDKNVCPWILSALKPIQLSQFDFDQYLEARAKITTDDWIDTLLQSIGFNPDMFGRRSKLTQLVRLIPFCERNYNLIELGPKGTGKSHIYSEFSPHGILISGGEVTVPKLFVNNTTGKIGLVGYWDCVAFDEFAGKQKRVDKALVDIMKNYMANKSFSRGVETLGAEASMVFVGNTQHTVPYMLKHSDLFSDLPEKFYDSAFLDRIHFYIPGWEVDIIRGEIFSDGYGFVVDYFAEILRSLRNHDYSNRYQEYFSLSESISTRDKDGINKTFSGLMKILYPQGEASKEEIEEILKFAVEGRKRVKDQLMRIDSTYSDVEFYYIDKDTNNKHFVITLEETEYAAQYFVSDGDGFDSANKNDSKAIERLEDRKISESKHLVFQENHKGLSFDDLFADYVRGATKIEVTDPYLRLFYQIKNFMEFIETIIKVKPIDQEVVIDLTTVKDEFDSLKQDGLFQQIKDSCAAAGINFNWIYSEEHLHARYVITDTGWKISLDRGFDIFQQYDMKDAFALSNRLQQYRACKAFEITYLHNNDIVD